MEEDRTRDDVIDILVDNSRSRKKIARLQDEWLSKTHGQAWVSRIIKTR